MKVTKTHAPPGGFTGRVFFASDENSKARVFVAEDGGRVRSINCWLCTGSECEHAAAVRQHIQAGGT